MAPTRAEFLSIAYLREDGDDDEEEETDPLDA
jgi:hypothetical protein